jgi:hypothetical protein
MKTAFVTICVAAMLLASGAKAQDITITWQVSDKNIGTGYLPKLASDGQNSVVTIDQINEGTKRTYRSLFSGVSAFQSQTGIIDAASVAWAGGWDFLHSPPQKTHQVGLAPSIALAFQTAYPNYDTAIEVHQGAQHKDGSLWYQLGSSAPPFDDIVWSHADHYGKGYNATVAADLNQESGTTTTVVEVHEESEGLSPLWYKVGVLTLGSSPSIVWGPTTEINSGTNQGVYPTVSVANNLAVLVAEGTEGALWYAIGVVDPTTFTITWTDPIPYGGAGGGYNPTVSVYGDGTSAYGIGKGRVVVEAHQLAPDAGSLVYSAGLLTPGAGGSAPTSISWSTSVNNFYANGCYPSIALSFDGSTPANSGNGKTSNLSLTETHETECGTAPIDYSFGYLVSTP